MCWYGRDLQVKHLAISDYKVCGAEIELSWVVSRRCRNDEVKSFIIVVGATRIDDLLNINIIILNEIGITQYESYSVISNVFSHMHCLQYE